jgi:hypothetical protein
VYVHTALRADLRMEPHPDVLHESNWFGRTVPGRALRSMGVTMVPAEWKAKIFGDGRPAQR